MIPPIARCPVWHPACFSHYLSHSTTPLDCQRSSRSPRREERQPGAQPRRSWARQGSRDPAEREEWARARGEESAVKGSGSGLRGTGRQALQLAFPAPRASGRGAGGEMLSPRPGDRRQGSSLSSSFSISTGGTATAGAAQAHCAPRSLQFPSPVCGTATVWAAAAGGALLP